jgi:ribonuclease P protein component
MIHQGPPSDDHRLGFVLPKKFVKYAVQRNQIKRWSKAMLTQSLWESMPPSTLIVRVNTPVPKVAWLTSGRAQTREALRQALDHALERLKVNQDNHQSLT